MTTETDRLAGGWALTGFAWLAAGLWVLASLSWPLAPLGVLLAVHAVRSLRLSRRLAAGRNDPRQRNVLAKTLVVDATALALLRAATLLFRR